MTTMKVRHISWHYLKEQQIEPRESHGVDFGAEGKVLLIGPTGRRLVWRKGSMCWVGIGMDPRYHPVHLEVLGPNISGIGIDLLTGGRLTSARLAQVWKRIEELLLSEDGAGPLDIKINKTLKLDYIYKRRRVQD